MFFLCFSFLAPRQCLPHPSRRFSRRVYACEAEDAAAASALTLLWSAAASGELEELDAAARAARPLADLFPTLSDALSIADEILAAAIMQINPDDEYDDKVQIVRPSVKVCNLDSRIRITLTRGERVAHILAPPGSAGNEGEAIVRQPLLLVLHAAGKGMLWQVEDEVCDWAQRSAAQDFVCLYPEACDHTWDWASRKDVEFIESCLRSVQSDFLTSHFRLEPSQIAAMGLSDGGSMALSLAAHNPAVFQAVLTAGAGFCLSPPAVGAADEAEDSQSPATGLQVVMLHGSEDEVFSIDSVGRPLRDALDDLGYSVDFRERDGEGHVPGGWVDQLLDAWRPAAHHDACHGGLG